MVRQKIAVTACLGTAGHVLLVAAVALVHAGPGALPVVDAFGAVEGLSMYCDVVRDDLPRRRRDGHRHGVWHPDVLHLREVPRGGSVLGVRPWRLSWITTCSGRGRGMEGMGT